MVNRVRAEHPSVGGYLEEHLPAEAARRPLLVSFNEWDFAQAALADIALGFRALGSDPVVALWADRTPMRDVGWTTDHRVARFLGTRGLQRSVAEGLRRSGMARKAIAEPPVRRWKPTEPLMVPASRTRPVIRETQYRGTPMGRAILQVTPDRQTPVSDEHIWPTAWLAAAQRSYAWAFDQVLALIEQSAATCVVAYNGRFLHDSAVVAAAERAGLPVLSFDTGGSQTDFDLTVDATHDWSALQRRMLALYGRWPIEERDELGSSWFLERRRHIDPQNAQYTDAQRPGLGIKVPDGKRVVVYFSSSGDEIAELDLDWSRYFGGQPGAVMALARVVRELPDHMLVVRSHPHKRRKPARDVAEWLAVVDEIGPDVHLDPSSEVDSYALMDQADAVVTFGSTTGVEAAFAGIPSIVMGPSAYDDLGCARAVHDEDALREAIVSPAYPLKSGAVAYGLLMKRRGFTYEFVQRQADGSRMLAGVPLVQAAPRAMHVSHWLGTRAQARLARA